MGQEHLDPELIPCSNSWPAVTLHMLLECCLHELEGCSRLLCEELFPDVVNSCCRLFGRPQLRQRPNNDIDSSLASGGIFKTPLSASVTSGNAFKVFHGVFFRAAGLDY